MVHNHTRVIFILVLNNRHSRVTSLQVTNFHCTSHDSDIQIQKYYCGSHNSDIQIQKYYCRSHKTEFHLKPTLLWTWYNVLHCFQYSHICTWKQVCQPTCLCVCVCVWVFCKKKKVSWYFEPSQPQRITSGLKQSSVCLLFTLHTSHQTKNSLKKHKISPDTNLHCIKHTQM